MRKPIEQRLREKQKVDLGFWNQEGEYVEDVQEVDFSKEQGAETNEADKKRT